MADIERHTEFIHAQSTRQYWRLRLFLLNIGNQSWQLNFTEKDTSKKSCLFRICNPPESRQSNQLKPAFGPLRTTAQSSPYTEKFDTIINCEIPLEYRTVNRWCSYQIVEPSHVIRCQVVRFKFTAGKRCNRKLDGSRYKLTKWSISSGLLSRFHWEWIYLQHAKFLSDLFSKIS